MAASIIAGVAGVATSAAGTIGDIVLGVQNLELQKQQLQLNQQALQQNKELSQQSMALTAAMPWIEAKAAGAAQLAQMEAKYKFYESKGADAVSLLAIGQGKTVYSSGSNRVATIHNTGNTFLQPHHRSSPNVPILMDITKRPKTSTVGTQVGNPNVGTQPAKGTQTPKETSTSSIGVMTSSVQNVSTQIGYPFVLNSKNTNFKTTPTQTTKQPTTTSVGTQATFRQIKSGSKTNQSTTVGLYTNLRNYSTSSTQTSDNESRSREEQREAVGRQIAFYGVGINNAVKPFYRDALLKNLK